jgi:hypothetical protein
MRLTFLKKLLQKDFCKRLSFQCLDFRLKHYNIDELHWGCFTGYLK